MWIMFFYSLIPGFGAQQSGTVVKFNPPAGQDVMVKNGVTQNINTKHQCITAMKEYEGKSCEVCFALAHIGYRALISFNTNHSIIE